MKHVASLDGLRGLAVLMVVFFHYTSRAGTGVLGLAASASWAGVDMFLVLSGFLITTILFEQRGAERYFRNFYTRRALRLFPLYYFILLALCVLTPFLHIHWRLAQLSLFAYFSNYFLASDMSLGTVGRFELFHTWTLSLEEQFYLVWPWLVGALVLSRQRLIQICLGGILLAPLVRIGFLAFHLPIWDVASALPCRMDSLLVGAGLALIPMPSLRTARIVLVCALAPLPFLVWWAHSLNFLTYPMQTAGYTCIAFACAALLVLSMYPTTVVHKVAILKGLRFYGRYSYGLYLWHYVFRVWFLEFQAWVLLKIGYPVPATILSFLLILLASTLIAMASYRFLEWPFLQLKRRFER